MNNIYNIYVYISFYISGITLVSTLVQISNITAVFYFALLLL